jgi:hypothetical protein
VHGCSKENFCLICGEKEPKCCLLLGVRASQYADMVWVVPVLHNGSVGPIGE